MSKGRDKEPKYTDEDRAACLAALAANGGNLSLTARQCGVPRNTLRRWVESQAACPPVATAATPKKEACDTLPALVVAAKDALDAKLERVANVLVGHLLDEGKIADATLSQVAVAAGVAIDKMRLLREQATSISGASLTDEERARRLEDLHERVRSRLAAAADSPGAG